MAVTAGKRAHSSTRTRYRRHSEIGRVRRTTGLLGELLITLGVLLLLFVVWQLWWTDVAALRQQTATIRTLEHRFGGTGKPTGALADDRSKSADAKGFVKASLAIPKPKLGQPFAIIRIPRFGADYARPIIEGTSSDQLSKGVGHYVDTAMPGGVGNLGLAGHRTTYGAPFSRIDALQKGDAVIIETMKAYYVYRVQRHIIVTPDQVNVLAPVPQEPGEKPQEHWLTMTSCHPRFYSTHRWVTLSQLNRVIPQSEGLPQSLLQAPGEAN